MAPEGPCFPQLHPTDTWQTPYLWATNCQHPAPTHTSGQERDPGWSCPLPAPVANRSCKSSPSAPTTAPHQPLLWAPAGPPTTPTFPLPHRQALGRTVLPPSKTLSLEGGSLQWTPLFWEEAARHLSGLIKVIVEIFLTFNLPGTRCRSELSPGKSRPREQNRNPLQLSGVLTGLIAGLSVQSDPTWQYFREAGGQRAGVVRLLRQVWEA